MNPKYFYYISDQKVTMLKAQLNSWGVSIPDINPKIEFAGLSFGANVKFQKDENIIRETLLLLKGLQKGNFIKSLDSGNLDLSNYYQDESSWFSGLFSFEPLIEKKVGAYILWKTWNNSIILLVGSPHNIIGATEQQTLMGTPLVIENLLDFMEVASQKKETLTPLETTEFDSSWSVIDIDRVFSFRGLYPDKDREPQPGEGAIIALFCAKHLRRLRQQKVETLFKIFREVEINRKIDLPQLIKGLSQTSLPSSEVNDLSRCKKIYVGSPIYTALK